jgi:uncharacterized membrane protein YfcA
LDSLNHIILFLVSLVANMFSAFSGGGAGLFQLPAIIFIGLAFKTALATHKVATVALGIGATVRHTRERTLQRNFSLYILAAGLPGVVIGALVIAKIDNRVAEIALGLLTIGLGVYSGLQSNLGQEYQPKNRDRRGLIIGAITLLILGAINGSLTSGTGLFVTLCLIKWFGLDYKRAVAYTLVLVGVFWNGTGALTLGMIVPVQWELLPALILGSLIGGYLGAHMSIVAGNRLIKRGFEIMTILVGLALIFKPWIR